MFLCNYFWKLTSEKTENCDNKHTIYFILDSFFSPRIICKGFVSLISKKLKEAYYITSLSVCLSPVIHLPEFSAFVAPEIPSSEAGETWREILLNFAYRCFFS
jgi:hypothetical protein